jgi:hypothetical protein
MHDITPAERVMMTQFFADVMNAVDATVNNTDPKAIDKIRGYIPKYELHLGFRAPGYTDHCEVTRYFSFVDHRMKGKKRVYVSRDQFRNDIYIFYMSKEKLQKLCKSDIALKWLINTLGNKWICTLDGYRFKDAYNLIGRLLAVEAGFSRNNRPPTSNNTFVWCGNQQITATANRYREVGVRYLVDNATLLEYDLTKKCGQIWS